MAVLHLRFDVMSFIRAFSYSFFIIIIITIFLFAASLRILPETFSNDQQFKKKSAGQNNGDIFVHI